MLTSSTFVEKHRANLLPITVNFTRTRSDPERPWSCFWGNHNAYRVDYEPKIDVITKVTIPKGADVGFVSTDITFIKFPVADHEYTEDFFYPVYGDRYHINFFEAVNTDEDLTIKVEGYNFIETPKELPDFLFSFQEGGRPVTAMKGSVMPVI